MFTGIVAATSKVVAREASDGNVIFDIEAPEDWNFTLGQSISVSGICSTVIRCTDTTFSVLHMPETLSKTTSAKWEAGDLVNLERSLTLQDYVDGHLVQGHVDATAAIVDIVHGDDGSVTMRIEVPDACSLYIATKGSIAVNGVSLTVSSRTDTTFSVSLIPYTLEHTNLHALSAKDIVNIEVDVVARYIIAAQQYR